MALCVLAVSSTIPIASLSSGVSGNDTGSQEHTVTTLEDTETVGPFVAVLQGQGFSRLFVEPLSDGSLAEEFYGYSDSEAHTATGIEESDVSSLFLWEDEQGIKLVVLHDHGSDGTGGAASFDFSGGHEGTWTVTDDHGDFPDGSATLAPDWSWVGDKTDGGVYRLSGELPYNVTIDPAFNEEAAREPLDPGSITSWQFLSGDPIAPEAIALDMERPISIEIEEFEPAGGEQVSISPPFVWGAPGESVPLKIRAVNTLLEAREIELVLRSSNWTLTENPSGWHWFEPGEARVFNATVKIPVDAERGNLTVVTAFLNTGTSIFRGAPAMVVSRAPAFNILPSAVLPRDGSASLSALVSDHQTGEPLDPGEVEVKFDLEPAEGPIRSASCSNETCYDPETREFRAALPPGALEQGTDLTLRAQAVAPDGRRSIVEAAYRTPGGPVQVDGHAMTPEGLPLSGLELRLLQDRFGGIDPLEVDPAAPPVTTGQDGAYAFELADSKVCDPCVLAVVQGDELVETEPLPSLAHRERVTHDLTIEDTILGHFGDEIEALRRTLANLAFQETVAAAQVVDCHYGLVAKAASVDKRLANLDTSAELGIAIVSAANLLSTSEQVMRDAREANELRNKLASLEGMSPDVLQTRFQTTAELQAAIDRSFAGAGQITGSALSEILDLGADALDQQRISEIDGALTYTTIARELEDLVDHPQSDVDDGWLLRASPPMDPFTVFSSRAESLRTMLTEATEGQSVEARCQDRPVDRRQNAVLSKLEVNAARELAFGALGDLATDSLSFHLDRFIGNSSVEVSPELDVRALSDVLRIMGQKINRYSAGETSHRLHVPDLPWLAGGPSDGHDPIFDLQELSDNYGRFSGQALDRFETRERMAWLATFLRAGPALGGLLLEGAVCLTAPAAPFLAGAACSLLIGWGASFLDGSLDRQVHQARQDVREPLEASFLSSTNVALGWSREMVDIPILFQNYVDTTLESGFTGGFFGHGRNVTIEWVAPDGAQSGAPVPSGERSAELPFSPGGVSFGMGEAEITVKNPSTIERPSGTQPLPLHAEVITQTLVDDRPELTLGPCGPGKHALGTPRLQTVELIGDPDRVQEIPLRFPLMSAATDACTGGVLGSDTSRPVTENPVLYEIRIDDRVWLGSFVVETRMQQNPLVLAPATIDGVANGGQIGTLAPTDELFASATLTAMEPLHTMTYTAAADAKDVILSLVAPSTGEVSFTVVDDEGRRAGHLPSVGRMVTEFPAVVRQTGPNNYDVQIPDAAGRSFEVRTELRAARGAEIPTALHARETPIQDGRPGLVAPPEIPAQPNATEIHVTLVALETGRAEALENVTARIELSPDGPFELAGPGEIPLAKLPPAGARQVTIGLLPTDPGLVPEGRYPLTVSLKAETASGEPRATNRTMTVVLDGTGPITTITGMGLVENPNGRFLTPEGTFRVDAADETTGVAASYYQIDDGPVQSATGPIHIEGPEGTHTLTAWSIDHAGNPGPVDTLAFQTDRTAPSILHLSGFRGPPGPGAIAHDDTVVAGDGDLDGYPDVVEQLSIRDRLDPLSRPDTRDVARNGDFRDGLDGWFVSGGLAVDALDEESPLPLHPGSPGGSRGVLALGGPGGNLTQPYPGGPAGFAGVTLDAHGSWPNASVLVTADLIDANGTSRSLEASKQLPERLWVRLHLGLADFLDEGALSSGEAPRHLLDSQLVSIAISMDPGHRSLRELAPGTEAPGSQGAVRIDDVRVWVAEPEGSGEGEARPVAPRPLDPETPHTVLSGQPTLEFIAKDPELSGAGSSFSTYEFLLDGEPAPGSSRGFGRWTLDLRDQEPGLHTLTVQATDAAGNRAIRSLDFLVPSQP